MKTTIAIFGFALLFIACASRSAREKLGEGTESQKEQFVKTSQASQKLAASETNERIVISHLAQYATITIEAGKGVKKGVLGYVFYAAYAGVKWLFVR